jgi:peptidoglycan L-alanyl-D-glutamate endopeptidase CwlK
MEAAILDTPVDFTITEGLRSDERQQNLYAQGRSRSGPRVTNADGVHNLSNHQDAADGKRDGIGQAVDLYPYFDGKVQVSGPKVDAALHTIAAHIKKTAARLGIAITWGGDWKSPYDPPHFQITKK